MMLLLFPFEGRSLAICRVREEKTGSRDVTIANPFRGLVKENDRICVNVIISVIVNKAGIAHNPSMAADFQMQSVRWPALHS